MAKKRRTREQKQRTASRRKDIKAPITETVEPPGILQTKQLEPIAQVEGQQSASKNLSGWNPYQRRFLRLSLILLGSLVAAQLAIWLLFHFTAIDDSLYELIKL